MNSIVFVLCSLVMFIGSIITVSTAIWSEIAWYRYKRYKGTIQEFDETGEK